MNNLSNWIIWYLQLQIDHLLMKMALDSKKHIQREYIFTDGNETRFEQIDDFGKLGFECSGIISRIDSKVTKFKVVLDYIWKSTSSLVNFQDAFNGDDDDDDQILPLITDMIKNKELSPIPKKEYPINQIKDGIDDLLVKENILVKLDGLVQDTIKSLQQQLKNHSLVVSPNFKFMGDYLGKIILLTGQTDIKIYKVSFVISKSPIKNELQYVISLTKSQSLKTGIYFKQENCSNFDEMKEISEIYEKEDPALPPVETIFHKAFVPVIAEPSMAKILQSQGSRCASVSYQMDYKDSKVESEGV
ncbi:hypothetical protein ACTA71_000207 [Dictyostelium dimigraforme]